jgi:hypothetical protein
MKKERLEELKTLKDSAKKKLKDKPFKNLSTKEKDELLETMARMLGLIK